jgi:amidase
VSTADPPSETAPPSVAVTGDLAWLDATAQAELVATGAVSPAELVEAAVTRIEAVNPQINAVIHPRFARARDEVAAGPVPGPFNGVPVVIKDLGASSAGDPNHFGLRVARDAHVVADHDAAVVARFRRAGFVIVGRTNTPELGTTVTTEPLAYGPSRNPWDLSRSTGGSSGGSAAAVASGMVPVAHATDGGGSIRIPAANCGLVGLKPTRGRISRGPDSGEGWMGGSTDGAVTRSVRDAAAVLDVLAGREPGDPYTAPALLRPLAAEVGVDPGRLRIGWLDHPTLPGLAADATTRAAVHDVAGLLASLGHDVGEGHPAALDDDEEEYRHRFLTVVACGVAADLAGWEDRLGRTIGDAELEHDNAALRAAGRSVSAPDYVRNINWMHAFGRRLAGWWAGHDLLLTPVLNGPPPPIGWLSDPELGGRRVATVAAYTSYFNMSGQPAISLPLHWSEAGLPIGVQLVASSGREDVLVRIAAQLESARPWASRRPPVHA